MNLFDRNQIIEKMKHELFYNKVPLDFHFDETEIGFDSIQLKVV